MSLLAPTLGACAAPTTYRNYTMPAVLSPSGSASSEDPFALTDGNSILYEGGIRVVHAAEAASAPTFTLRDFAGRVHTPESLAGRVVWIDLWADWCATCRAEFPAIQEIHDGYEGEGLTILAVCRNSTREGFVAAADKFWISFPVVDASEDGTFPFPYAAFPTNILIDRSGRIRSYWQGHRDLTAVEHVIRSLLAEAPDAASLASAGSIAVLPSPRTSRSVVLARLELPGDRLDPGALLEGSVVLDLAPGWHLTAGSAEGSIPVSVQAEGTPGLGRIDFLLPRPERRDLAGTSREVYSGRVELPLWGLVRSDAYRLGPQTIRVVATVQACDTSQCLVPSEIHLSGEIQIAGSLQ